MKSSKTNHKKMNEVILHQKVLLEISKMHHTHLNSTLKKIMEMDAKTLNVERASVWLFDKEKTKIVCAELYKLSSHRHERGIELKAKDYPKYFKALEKDRIIPADNACKDPRTNEFTWGYLKPLGITSMMDVPIRLNGKMVGTICHEHTGTMKKWQLEEQTFAASIADFVSLAFGEFKRREIEEKLRQSREDLEVAVLQRTFDLNKSNRKLKLEIIERKKAENALKEHADRLCEINRCFLSFSADSKFNINQLTSLVGRLLKGDCALYSRIDDRSLTVLGQWNTPKDFKVKNSPEGLICPVVVKSEVDEAFLVRDLQKSPYAETDPNVRQYKFDTYLGHPVKSAGKYVGTVCIFYKHDFVPSEEDKRILGIVASALGVEEKRMQNNNL